MRTFIQKLKQCYDRRREHLALDTQGMQTLQYHLNALRLADAALAKLALNDTHPEHAPHIGILGPTQAGKSTLVNLLSGQEYAGVSPLAGYTVHAQGFALGPIEEDDLIAVTQSMFPDFIRVEQSALDMDQLDSYSLSSDPSASTSTQVLWDSPDFDSVESRGYRSAVLRVAALADVVILMTSKDKYADKSVWDMLSLVLPLRKPLLVCINKLSSEDTAVVTESFLRRFGEAFPDNQQPPVLPLPYIKGLDTNASQIPDTVRESLRSGVQQGIDHINRSAESRHTYQLIQKHWNDWLEPVHVELEAHDRWVAATDTAIDHALDSYASGFLDHPRKYDTFNRALAELLTLLEIPGLANTLGTTRKLVTWPVRKLFHLGRSVVDRESVTADLAIDLEKDVLQQVLQQLISRLGNTALEQAELEQQDASWWKALHRELRKQDTDIESRFEIAVEQYQVDFAPQIELAAQALYRDLQKQPALLNTLRAARVSTDTAAVILAVKSGGLAATDLVLAPAMLSLTTMLTEGALGKYMDTVKADLQQQQRQRVQELLQSYVRDHMAALPSSLTDERLMGITRQELAAAESALDEQLKVTQ